MDRKNDTALLRRKRKSMIKLPCNKCNGCVSSSSHRLKSAGALIMQLRENFGHSEMLCACYTYQFNDYSRYAVTVFDEADKRRYNDEHFPLDLQKAYALGKRLVEEK